ENATPHGFLRLGSVLAASPGMSETRLVWVKESAWMQVVTKARARVGMAVARRQIRWLCGILRPPEIRRIPPEVLVSVGAVGADGENACGCGMQPPKGRCPANGNVT